MKTINNYINEALIKKDTKIKTLNYFPKDKDELKSLIAKLLNERGKDADLNDIDTSAITDMDGLFFILDPHNIDISDWDVSNVKHMRHMFYHCKKFNSDLSNWNVRNVEDMCEMFAGCKKFNCDLSNWNVSKLIDKKYMFDDCNSLKNIPSWYKN